MDLLESMWQRMAADWGLGQPLLSARVLDPRNGRECVVALRRQERPMTETDFPLVSPVGTLWEHHVCGGSGGASPLPPGCEVGLAYLGSYTAVYGLLPEGAAMTEVSAWRRDPVLAQVGHGLYLAVFDSCTDLVVTFRDSEGRVVKERRYRQ